MQTFLPYANFTLTAEVLDRQRLGKQRVETNQILTALIHDRGWVNHPAVKMWAGYEFYLVDYQEAIVGEWVRRGYRDNVCMDTAYQLLEDAKLLGARRQGPPPWLGNEDFHFSHRSNLLRKDFEHYYKYFGDIPDDIPYIWPVRT